MIVTDKKFFNEVNKWLIKNYGNQKISSLVESLTKKNPKGCPAKATIYGVFEKNSAALATLNTISIHIGYKSYPDLLDVTKHIVEKKNKLDGIWISYRFSQKRQLNKAIWTFNFNEKKDILTVEKKTKSDKYNGEFEVEEDFLLTGKLVKGTSILFYSGYLEVNETKKITLNLSYKKGNEQFFMQEVLYRRNKAPIKSKPSILGSNIPLAYNHNTGLADQDYEAYDYLTKLAGHSRARILDQEETYHHDIFISCPVRSFSENDRENFKELKDKVIEIKEILTEKYKFRTVHCEILNSEFMDIDKNEKTIFQESMENLNLTHFISIIPATIDQKNSGVFFEIYYRISRNLPCLVFYDPNIHFPAVLAGFIRDKKQVNVSFIPKKVNDIPGFLRRNTDLFDYSIE